MPIQLVKNKSNISISGCAECIIKRKCCPKNADEGLCCICNAPGRSQRYHYEYVSNKSKSASEQTNTASSVTTDAVDLSAYSGKLTTEQKSDKQYWRYKFADTCLNSISGEMNITTAAEKCVAMADTLIEHLEKTDD
jgi:hypothetical protein